MTDQTVLTGARLSRRQVLTAAGGAALGCLVSRPGLFGGQATAWAAPARTLRMGDASDIFTVDPVDNTDNTTHMVLSQMYECLIQMGRAGRFEGVLAERWEVLDPTTVRFQLRPGVKFHNGDALTSDDIKFTFDHLTDPALKSPDAPVFEPMDAVVPDGPLTVLVKTKRPYAALFSLLYGMWIIPAKYYQRVGATGFARAPVGTGAYRFREWTKDVHVVMEAFPGYWRGAPPVHGFQYRPIPEDAARVAALQNNEVDLIHPLPVDQITSLKAQADLQVATRPGQQIYCGLDTLTFKPFTDRRVRQAINYGVNVDSIVKNLFLGYATRLNGPFFIVTPGYDPSLAAYPYDPAKAKQLLAEAGYGSGFDVTLTVPTGIQGAQKLPEVGEAIAGDLARIGVRAKIEQVESAEAFSLYRALKFQMYIFPWGSSPESGLHVETLLASYTRGYYYKNPEADKLIQPYMQTLDPAKRAALGRRLLRFLHDDAPWLFLYEEPDVYGFSKNVVWTPNKYDYIIHVDEVKMS
jgi:peptide/nickel transport system substrate-binding protein